MTAKLGAPLAVGLMFLVAVVMLVYMFRTVESDTSASGETYTVLARFDDVSGLVKGSRVTISGIPVGTIASVQLDPDNLRKALVAVRLAREIKLPEGVQDQAGFYRNGTLIRRLQSSLLGDYYLEIVPGIEGPPIADGGHIRNVVSLAGLDAVMAKMDQGADIVPALNKILVDLTAVTSNLKGSLGGDQGAARLEAISESVAKSADNLQKITSDLRAFMEGGVAGQSQAVVEIIQNVERFTTNAERISEQSGELIRQSLENLRAITSDVRGIVGQSGPDVQQSLGTIKGTLEKVEESLDILQETLDTLHHVARKVDRGDGTVGRLVNDDRLVNDLEDTMSGASDFVTKVVRLQTSVAVQSDYFVRGESFRTAFQVRLQPRDDMFYLFELVDQPRATTKTFFRSTITDAPSEGGTAGKPVTISESVSTSDDRLKFSLQLAKRLWFTTWRLGLIESSGGVGLDVDVWKRHLTVSAECFDLGIAGTNPRLRTFLQFQFLRYFFLSAGADDLANADGRDGFVGVGLRFVDEDLKTLFFTAPSVQF